MAGSVGPHCARTHARALSDAVVPDNYEALPWPDRYRITVDGTRVHRYSHWLEMQVLEELPSARPQRWSSMVRELGLSADGNTMPVKLPQNSEATALSWFQAATITADYEPSGGSVESVIPQRLAVFNRLSTDTRVAAPDHPSVLDPDVIGEALNRHNSTINRLAEVVRRQGLQPCLLTSWFSEKPDLVWLESNNCLNIAEVKGISSINELSQMRLGLGQVLRYRHRASSSYHSVQAWLVTDKAPLDPLWDSVCESVGVFLWWPRREWPSVTPVSATLRPATGEGIPEAGDA